MFSETRLYSFLVLLASLLLPYLSHFCSNYTQLACLHWLGAGSAVLRVGVRVVLDRVTGGCAGSSCSQGAAGCVLGRSAPLSTSTLCLAGREARGGAQGSQFSPGAGSRTQLALSPARGVRCRWGVLGAEQRGGGGSCTTSSPSPQKYSRGSGLMGAAGHVPRCGAEHLAAVSSPASRVTRLSLCQADRCKV